MVFVFLSVQEVVVNFFLVLVPFKLVEVIDKFIWIVEVPYLWRNNVSAFTVLVFCDFKKLLYLEVFVSVILILVDGGNHVPKTFCWIKLVFKVIVFIEQIILLVGGADVRLSYWLLLNASEEVIEVVWFFNDFISILNICSFSFLFFWLRWDGFEMLVRWIHVVLNLMSLEPLAKGLSLLVLRVTWV